MVDYISYFNIFKREDWNKKKKPTKTQLLHTLKT
jgi:hypothetical protein